MEYTADKIGTQIILLLSLLIVFAIFKMIMWYDNENNQENVMDNICIRCSNCGKKKDSSVKIKIKKT